MRMIERSTAFKRDYKKIKATPRYRDTIDLLLSETLKLLSTDKSLPEKNFDHRLSGDWCGYRECHLRPDLLLIYSKPNQSILRLVRLGSHSELFE